MERSRPHPDAEATLAKRAKELACAATVDDDRELLTTVVLVRIGTDQVGLPAEDTQGVHENVSVTPVLGLPPWFAGVAQVRGELMTIVHPSHWLQQSASIARGMVAVVAGKQGTVGIVIDDVLDTRDVYASDVSDSLTRQARREQRPIRLVTNDLVAVLDVERFMNDPDLVVGRTASPGT